LCIKEYRWSPKVFRKTALLTFHSRDFFIKIERQNDEAREQEASPKENNMFIRWLDGATSLLLSGEDRRLKNHAAS